MNKRIIDKRVIDIIYNNLITIYGKIKINDIVFINDYDILIHNQNIILNIIKNNINKKIIEHNLNLTNSYHSNIIWVFDKNTQIINIDTKPNNTNKKMLVYTGIGFFISIIILLSFYHKKAYVGITIFILFFVAIMGFYIVFNKLHLFDKIISKEEKENIICENNIKDFIKLFNIFQEIYDFDIFLLKEKKYIKDNLKIFQHIVSKNDCLNKLNNNKDKYSKMITTILEYVGMLDIYITLAKLIIKKEYILPEYIDITNNIYLELINDKYIKFSDNLNILYVIGNFEKRNNFIENIIFNVCSCQYIGISNCSKIKYTPFTAVLDKDISDIYEIIELLDSNKYINNKYLIILTLTRDMNHYFMELLRKLVKYQNIILILSFDEIIKDLEIDKYLLKEF